MKNFPEHPKIQSDSEGNLWLNFGEYGESVEVASFSGDGSKLLTVQEVGIARIWDLQKGEPYSAIVPSSPLEEKEDSSPFGTSFCLFIESAALSPEGDLALLGLNDLTAGVFRVGDGKRLSVLKFKDADPAWGVIRGVNFSPDGSLVIVGFYNRSVGIWDSTGKNLLTYLGPEEGSRLVGKPFVRDTMVSSVALSQDNHFAFVGCADGAAYIWNLETKTREMEALEHAEKVIKIFGSAERVLWATTGGTIWEARENQSSERVLVTGENWAEVVFSPEGNHFLARTSQGEVSQWNLSEGQRIFCRPERGVWASHACSLAYQADDKTYLYPEKGNTLILVSEEKKVRLVREEQVVKALFSPRRDLIATEGWSDSIELWAVPSGEKVWSVEVPGGVGVMNFSFDGSLLVAGAIGEGGGRYPRDILIWDLDRKEQLYHLKGHTWQMDQVAFGPDNQWLVTFGGDLRFWELGSEREVEASYTLDPVNGFQELFILADGRTVVVYRDFVEVWHQLKKCLHRFGIPSEFEQVFLLNSEENLLGLALQHGVAFYSLETGKRVGLFRPSISFPESPFTEEILYQFEPVASALLWRGPGGPYLHGGDGPRGWVTPLRLSGSGKYTVVPGETEGAVVDVSAVPKLITTFPFEGQLRDSCVLQDRVLAVNSRGQIFSFPGEF